MQSYYTLASADIVLACPLQLINCEGHNLRMEVNPDCDLVTIRNPGVAGVTDIPEIGIRRLDWRSKSQ